MAFHLETVKERRSAMCLAMKTVRLKAIESELELAMWLAMWMALPKVLQWAVCLVILKETSTASRWAPWSAAPSGTPSDQQTATSKATL